MDNNKREMLKKLIEMKKELKRKQRKLEKIKRVVHAKAHIRQKISESENLIKDSHTTELSSIRSPSGNVRSPSSNVSTLYSNVSSPSSNIRSLSSNVRTPSNNVRSSSSNHSTADSQTKCPLMKVIKQSLNMRSHIDLHDHSQGNTCDGAQETDQEHKQQTEYITTAVGSVDAGCTQKSCGAIDDIKEDNKTQNCNVKSVDNDFFLHTSVIPYSEKIVHVSEEDQSSTPKFAIGKSLESLETDKACEPKVAATQLSHMAIESTVAEYNLQALDEQSMLINCVSKDEQSVNKHMDDVCGEHCEVIQMLAANDVSSSCKTGSGNFGLDLVVTSDSLEDRNTHEPCTDFICNINPARKNGRYDVLSKETESDSDLLMSVTNQTLHLSRVNRDSSKVNTCEAIIQMTEKEIGKNSESEDIVNWTPVNTVSSNPHLCSRKKNMSSDKNHLETTLSSSSFEHLMDQLSSKNVLQTSSDKESSLYIQETITDSEFFNALGLTQKGGEVLSREITENMSNHTPNKEKSETLSQIGNSYDKVPVKSHILQKLSNAAYVGTTPSVNTSTTDCSIQQDIAGKRLQVNSFNVDESGDTDCSQSVFVNSTDSFSEYTELDAIPYSQFELTEDFLSETQNSQESMNGHRVKKYGALVKRRSSRISSYNFTHPSPTSLTTNYSGSELADCDFAIPRLKLKQAKPAAEQTKAAAVLSVFQFLIDDAKKANSSLEFKLPCLYDSLKSSRLESAIMSNYLFETHSYAENKQTKVLQAEDSEVKNVRSCSHTLSLKKNVGKQASTVIRDTEAIEFTNVEKGDMRDVIRVDAVIDTCTDEVLYGSKLYSDSTEDQENQSSDRNVGTHLLGIDSASNNLTEVLADTRSSNVLRTNQLHVRILNGCITSGRKTRTPLSKSRGKLFHRSFGKNVAKMLFTAQNSSSCAEPHGSIYKTIVDKITTVSEIHSSCSITLPVENTSHQRVPLQESHLEGENISVKCTSSSGGDVVLTKAVIPSSVCDISTKLKTLCPSSPGDNIHLQTDVEPVLNIHTQFAGIDSAQAISSSLDVASSEFSASFLYNPSTPACTTPNYHMLETSSEGLCLTSTPKTVASHRTGCSTSPPEFDVSFDGNDKSNDRPLMNVPAERTEFHKLKIPVLQPQSSSDVSKSGFNSQSCQVLPEESCLSYIHSSEEVDSLHKESVPETPTDISSVIRRSDKPQNNVSHLLVTSSNFISPWKKLLKTASSPVLVLEQNTPRNYQITPVFSPFIRRSRSKLVNSGSRSQNILKFSGCFQPCAQDAVVTILTGHIKTKDDDMKPYIVSVQATSLTVWTDDDLSGWTTDMYWSLGDEIHIMKACLLSRNDSVIAIVASGWNKQSLFATLFLYDWSTEDTTRYNIPLPEQHYELQSPTQIELCSVTALELHIAMTSDTHYVIGQVLFNDSLKSVKCLSTSQVQRGKLLSFVTVNGLASANLSLTADQEITVWNMKLCIAVKKIKADSSLPCLSKLLAATSHKGLLLLDTIWRMDDGDCGGVIAVNPLTGCIQKIVTFSVPNNTWRGIESAQSEATFVTAISDKSSLSIWNRSSGALLGYTKSKTTTCASIATFAKHLIIGDIRGCLHIYSALY